MKKIRVLICSMMLLGFGGVSFATLTSTTTSFDCKIDGSEVGRTDVILTFAGSTVRVISWIEMLNSPGEYVGFQLEVIGDPVVFLVKTGTEIFIGSGTSWVNPNGLSGPSAKGISHIDFCGNEPPTTTTTIEEPTTTTLPDPTTTTTMPDITTTTVERGETTTTLTEATSTTEEPTTTTMPDPTTTTMEEPTTTTLPDITTTTMPLCEAIPILNDPAYVDWIDGRFFIHGRLLPLEPVDYPITWLDLTLATTEDGVWHELSCYLEHPRPKRWKCKTDDLYVLVKTKKDQRSGMTVYAFRIRQSSSTIEIPTSQLITTTVTFLCEPGVNVADWKGELGDKIVNKF